MNRIHEDVCSQQSASSYHQANGDHQLSESTKCTEVDVVVVFGHFL